MTANRSYGHKESFNSIAKKRPLLIVALLVSLGLIVTISLFALSRDVGATDTQILPYHETIDGFVSFYVTGNVMVEAVPLLYNQRDSHLMVSVMVVKGYEAENYKYNKVSVFHFRDNKATEIDWVKSFPITPLQHYFHYDPDFKFDFTVDDGRKTYRVSLFNTVNLEVKFALSAYISMDEWNKYKYK